MWVVMLYVSLLLAVVTRPGLVVFGAGLLVSLFAILARREGLDRAIRFTLYGVVLLFVPGVVFLVSRYAYFGYWFPNSFYVKASSGVVSVVGAKTVFEFLTIVVGPVSFVGLLAVLSRPASSEIRDRFVRVGPILTGTALFLGLWFFIDPLQGFLWRFQLPVLPAILLSVASVSRGYSVPFPRVPVATFFVVLAVLGMTVLPLHTFDDAGANADRRDQTDRVIAGESLRHLNSDYRMFVTESGALPYYSGWVAVDELGLNSEYVAHNGLSRTFLSDYDPDLVMVRVDGGPNMLRSRSPVTAGYLANGSYRLVAAVDKSGGVPNGYHLYFVDIDSKGYDEIACTLLTMDGVEYVDRKYFVEASGIDVRKSEHTSQACR